MILAAVSITPYTIFLVVIIIWSLLGYWLIATDRIYRIASKVKSNWLASWVETLLEGPAWWVAEIVWRIIDRERSDRE